MGRLPTGSFRITKQISGPTIMLMTDMLTFRRGLISGLE